MFAIIKFINEQRIKKSLANGFRRLAKIQQLFFSAYLKPDYLSHENDYSRKLHDQCSAYFCEAENIRLLLRENHAYRRMYLGMEGLFEIMSSLHLLRYRVNEFSIFEICSREMQGLEKESTYILKKLSNAVYHPAAIINTDPLLEKIEAFENLYNRTIQIVARDPIIFIFFIQDLYAFMNKLDSIISFLQVTGVSLPLDESILLKDPDEV